MDTMGTVIPTSGDFVLSDFIKQWAYKIYEEREMVQMYIHLILAALFPIYIGSHASLHRPPSACPPPKASSSSSNSDSDDDDDDEIEVKPPTMEGLTPSDAILFPFFAAAALGGLYAIIKWMNDPALLNRILGLYFSALGVFGIGKLAGDALNVGTTFVFPDIWASKTEIFIIDPLLSRQVSGTTEKDKRGGVTHRKITDKTNPLPSSFLSSINLSPKINQTLWSFRAFLKNHWIFRFYIHGLVSGTTRVQINDVLGYLLGFAAIVLYNLNGKAWWLTNLMGFGFCYGTLQVMSPTTFWTGSLVLMGLFVYDIVMVFYTPLMITVATTLDVPIKLVFPGPKHGSMLGLGDIVLPGIIMSLALRFDLYLHYLHLQNSSPSPLANTSSPIQSNPAKKDDEKTKKPTYKRSTTLWGERFWTSSYASSSIQPSSNPPSLSFHDLLPTGARFAKPYFRASILGYIIAMLCTLIVLNVYSHAQPALLYLVPGVLGSLWGTALVRGEVRLMWGYTEDGSLDLKDEDREKDESGKEGGKGGQEQEKGKYMEEEKGRKEKATKELKKKEDAKKEHAHHVFLLSLSAPKARTNNNEDVLAVPISDPETYDVRENEAKEEVGAEEKSEEGGTENRESQGTEHTLNSEESEDEEWSSESVDEEE